MRLPVYLFVIQSQHPEVTLGIQHRQAAATDESMLAEHVQVAVHDAWHLKELVFVLHIAGSDVLVPLPFSGRAFSNDDPLFIWTAQHIIQQPLNPYGFEVNWNKNTAAMSDVTQNPPLAAYYMAAAGKIGGWSERTLHLAFLLPTIALVLGAYRLAKRFTGSPGIAAVATFVAPAFLVSSMQRNV